MSTFIYFRKLLNKTQCTQSLYYSDMLEVVGHKRGINYICVPFIKNSYHNKRALVIMHPPPGQKGRGVAG